MSICHICKETDTSTQIKGGCGCLVHICDQCRDEQAYIQHSSCIVCRGGKTPQAREDEMQKWHEESLMRDLYDTYYEEEMDNYPDYDYGSECSDYVD